MKKEKMNLRRADNLTLDELKKFMEANYELYATILDELIGINIDYELERLHELDGIIIYKIVFGSIYANNHDVDVTDVKKFLANDFSEIIDNETLYGMLKELKSEPKEELLKEFVNLLIQEVDERAVYEAWGTEDVLEYETDFFENYLNLNEIVVDLSTMKEYSSYELDELDIDYQDLD